MEQIINKNCLDYMKSQEFQNIVKTRKVVIVSDPPFNVGYHYGTYKDKMSEEEYYSMLKQVFTMYDLPFVCIHYPEQLYKLAIYIYIYPEKVISWVYNSNTGKQHRDIAFFKIKPNLNQIKQPYKNPTDKRIRERIEMGIDGGKLYDWWEINQTKNVSKKEINHPCVMPLEVMRNVIGILPKDILVYDPFCGSGTTGLACKEYGIDFIGTDIDENYCQLAKDRLETKLV